MRKEIDSIRELRKRTGAPVVDCKKALLECIGDFDKAEEVLIKKGFSLAQKKEERLTREGIIASYIHHDEKIGVLVELNCETAFVAKNAEFKDLAKNIAMQIAACSPLYISEEEVPQNILDDIPKEKREEYYRVNCLLNQIFIRDSMRTIKELISLAIARLGENIRIKRFTRFEVGK